MTYCGDSAEMLKTTKETIEIPINTTLCPILPPNQTAVNMAHNYILRVTAGKSYDPKDHKVVAVNTAEPMSISSEHMDIELNVRVQVEFLSQIITPTNPDQTNRTTEVSPKIPHPLLPTSPLLLTPRTVISTR